MKFQLTDLVMDWLNQHYLNRFRSLDSATMSFYEVIIGTHTDESIFTQHPESNVIFVGKDRVWLYTSIEDFSIVPSADATFFEQIDAHIKKYWVPTFKCTTCGCEPCLCGLTTW